MMTMVPSKKYILVRINKAMQNAKKEMNGDILLHPDFIFMERYLQFGEVVSVGERAAVKIPGIEVGCTAMFHHTIEDDDWRCIDTEKNGDELRLIETFDNAPNTEVFGFIKNDELFACKDSIFLDTQSINIVRPAFKSTLFQPDFEWDNPERLQEILVEIGEYIQRKEEDMKQRIYVNDELEYDRKCDVVKVIEGLYAQKLEITKLLNVRKVATAKVVGINDATSKETGVIPGDTILITLPAYPIDLFGHMQFFIIHQLNVLGKVVLD